MGRRGYVYILASQKNGTLYVGVTSDLAGRLLQHQTGTGSKFVARYGVMRLVWFDEYDLVVDAIAREKVIKKWPRQWKINLIEERNPHWHDIRGICFDGRHFVALVLHRRLALPFRHGFPTLSARSSLTRSRMTNCILDSSPISDAGDLHESSAKQPFSPTHVI